VPSRSSKNVATHVQQVGPSTKKESEMSKGLAVIYDRASTKKQDQNYTRLDVKRIGLEIAQRYGYETEAEPRFELKSGEELRNRAVMMGILSDIQSGKTSEGKKVTAVIVPNFTRLSRDEDIIDGLVIKKTCRDNGVVVIDFSGKIYNFENDNDQDAAFLEFWFASRDKRQLMSNMLRGQKERASQGKYMGGIAPFGYCIVPSGEVNKRGVVLKKRQIDPGEAKLIHEIFTLYCKMSAMATATKLNHEGKRLPIKNVKGIKKKESLETRSRPFTSADIMRIINNPLYAGWIRWNTGEHNGRPRSKYLKEFEPQVHFDPSLQIVSQKLFDRAQQIKRERYAIPSRAVSSRYPFSYILKCIGCGGPLGGTIFKASKQPQYRMHQYRCMVHYDFPEKCPKGQQITAWPVAYAVIPFVAKLLKDKTRLVVALEQAAVQYSNNDNGTLQQLEAATRAEIEKTSQGVKRLTDSIADGLISREEAKSKLQELREKKERLMRELQGFEERESIRAEILEAVKLINSDLEGALWNMFEFDQPALARIVRMIFKPHSVVVEGYWDKTLHGTSANPYKRKARIVNYSLREEFQDLDVAGSEGVVQSSVARAK